MTFFKELDSIIGTNTVTISVTKDKARLIVLVVPRSKDGEPIQDFVPMSISGTPEQLDAGFMMSMTKSLDLLNGIKANLDEIEKAAVKSKEKAAKSKTDKTPGKKTEKGATLDMPDNDEPEGADGLPFNSDEVDTETGEVKNSEPVKAGSKAKPEPAKAKPAAAKAPAQPVQATIAPEPEPTPEPIKSTDDEW